MAKQSDTRPIILASTSPYRRELLQKLAIKFTASAPNVDETPKINETPQQLVERLAREKAENVAKDHCDALVIGSDQVAVFNGDIIGKPLTHDNAVKQLSRFAGHKVTFLTGLALYDCHEQQCQSLVEPFEVHFRALSPQQIENYLRHETPYNCAGSFKSEGLGIALFSKLQGDDPNSLIGLPLIKLIALLEQKGIDILG